MLSEEEVKQLVHQRKIERKIEEYKKGEKNPELMNFILDYLETNKDDNLISYIFKKLNGTDIYEEIYHFIKVDKDLKRFLNIVLKTNNPEYLYILSIAAHKYDRLYTGEIKNFDYASIEENLIKLKNPKYIYKFALYFQTKYGYTPNIEKLEQAIIDIGDPMYIYLFACNINASNKKKLEEAMLATNDIIWIDEYAKNISCCSFVFNSIKCNQSKFDDKKINEFNIEEKYQQLKDMGVEIEPLAYKWIGYCDSKLEVLNKLLDNIDEEDNMLKVQVYGEFLKSDINYYDNTTCVYAYSLDLEYARVKTLRNVNNQS